MPLNNFTPETVREWRIYIKEYVAELPVNKDGHTMFSFDDAVGLQILQRDLAEMTRLSVVKKTDALSIKIPIKTKKAA